VRTGRRIGAVFEAVHKVVEGADGRRAEGGKAGDLGQAGMPPEVVGPLGQAFILQEQQQQERSEQTEGVVRGAAPGARRIAGSQQRARRVQVEAEEDQCSLPPGVGEPAELATQPALELLDEGSSILGMRWVHGGFLLGQEREYLSQPDTHPAYTPVGV